MNIALNKQKLLTALLTIGIFYFAFMILDRTLSLIYGFNFQPYGPHMPTGFTIWGHLFNGTLAATGLFITFKLYDYGKRKNRLIIQILALIIAFTVGAIIPYQNDAEHLAKNNVINTLPAYVIANDLYVFTTGLLTMRIAKTNKHKTILLATAFTVFLLIHYLLYAPKFPEFYWS